MKKEKNDTLKNLLRIHTLVSNIEEELLVVRIFTWARVKRDCENA